ncbi:MAG TPA: hypothetical protein VGZ29_14690 [Terriglobia bacterium]|nr:hypothetical protein [Terriglobia bacterium]
MPDPRQDDTRDPLARLERELVRLKGSLELLAVIACRCCQDHALRRPVLLILLLSALPTVPAPAQTLVTHEDVQRVNRLIDRGPGAQRLNCTITPAKPFMDFQFRFNAGFTIGCPLKIFVGQKTRLSTYIRVTPEGSEAVLLSGTSDVPAMPADMAASASPRKLNQDIELSGEFSLGDGRYRVELVTVDDQERACVKTWKVDAARRGGLQPAVILKPGSVEPAEFVPWKGKLVPNGLRITVLLDVAPVNPREPKLRAWDRTFLLDSLSALLRQLPCKSVRLAAFNLDQQQELFLEDSFTGGEEFDRLERAMERLELGTVSYSLLQRQQGWVDMLFQHVKQEASAAQPSDAVIILGPATHWRLKVINKGQMAALKGRVEPTHFFRFEYSAVWTVFPDALDTLTKSLGGTVLTFHSPQDLEHVIRKMQRQLKPAPETAVSGPWAPRAAPKE